MWVWGFNSGPHACIESTLPTELYPHIRIFLFLIGTYTSSIFMSVRPTLGFFSPLVHVGETYSKCYTVKGSEPVFVG